jgi:hypothetical protein
MTLTQGRRMMSANARITISIPYEGIRGYGTARFRRLHNEITYYVHKQYGAEWLADDTTQGGFVTVTFKTTSRRDMADFMATLKTDIKRTFKVSVVMDWTEAVDDEEA